MPSKKSRSAMGRAAKRKGAEGELELAAELRTIFGVEARRGRQFQGGPGSPDVKADILGLHWECKRTEGVSVYAALEQADGEAGPDEMPVVAHRRNRKRWVAFLYLEDLPEFARIIGETMKREKKGERDA